jgi:murein L,D-transpeptidase YcbB/YkuD
VALRLAIMLAACLALGLESATVGAAAPVERSAAPSLTAPVLNAGDIAILETMLAQAPAQGFDPAAFDSTAAAAQLKSSDPLVRGQGQARLIAQSLAYARAQHGGRMDGRFPENWAIRPGPYDAQADFDAALAAHGLAGWAASLPPPDERYAALIKVYARYQDIAAHDGWTSLAVKPALKLGATGDRVEALRRRLAVEDAAVPPPAYVPMPPVTPPAKAVPPVPLYDAALAEAVARAQTRYGLNPDGAAGPGTIAALNTPVEARLGQIRANLERWRWTPREMPAYRVELNIADASLVMFDAGKPALSMRAIVGQPSKQTPMFADRILAVVFNPPWNVPADIAASEIWPKIHRDPGYMAREGFVVRPGGGLQQLPGPECALGNIKFDLSNAFGVYLHDTPTRTLFAQDRRTLSHGCMRLEKPNLLAKRLLQDDSAWTQTRIDITLLAGKTVRAPLPAPVPLYVFYWTAFVDDEGQAAFRSDVYRWDQALLARLGAEAD